MICITIIIEVIKPNESINRITPLWNIHCVCNTHHRAIQYLNEFKNSLQEANIESHIEYEEVLYIDLDNGFNIGERYYFLRDIIVYGDGIHEYVYHLVRYNGYIIDYDKPYRCDSLGWFSSPTWAKQTKEWKIFYHLVSNNMISGTIYDDLIKLYGPYDICEMPSLVIHPYSIIR